AGDYSATFILTDGNFEVPVDVGIIVSDVNLAPVWVGYPEDNSVTGYVGEAITFDVVAEDPEERDVDIRWRYVEEPPAEPNVHFEVDQGRGRFTMEPDRDESGEYIVRFEATDGEVSSTLDIIVDVSADHFRYTVTGLAHNIRIDRVELFGEDVFRAMEDNDDLLDEIGVLTPDELVAGAFRFADYNGGDNENMENLEREREDQLGNVMTAWGDSPGHGRNGFRQNEEFTFVYWDHDEGMEYDVRATFTAGERAWRWRGFSVVELFIGQSMSISEESHDYGAIRVDETAEWDVTFTSNGSEPIEGLELTVEGDRFSLDDEGPFDLDVNEELMVRVTFSPDRAGEYSGEITAQNDYVEASAELRGIGIQSGHFDYEITETRHTLEVVRVEMDGEPLREGDEVGVFTPDDLCAGAVIVEGDVPYRLTAWGNNGHGNNVNGFREDEQFSFKLWDSDQEQEVNAVPTYLRGSDRWRRDGYTYVSLSSGDGHFNWIETETTHHLTIESIVQRGNYINREEIRLQDGDEIVVVTPRNLIAGGVVVEGEGRWEIDAYGDDAETEDVIEGFLREEPVYFRVWLQDGNRELLARAEEEPVRWEEEAETRLNLIIATENRGPVWRPLPWVLGIEEEELSFIVQAMDPERDPVSIFLLERYNLPDGVEFELERDGIGRFQWTPNYAQAGVYNAHFAAFDGNLYTELQVSVIIRNANHPPVLADIGDIEITEGEPFSLVLEATDSDSDNFVFSAEHLPFGAVLERNLFRWTPNYDQAGEYEEVIFRVTDFGQPPASDQEVITIIVLDFNRPPMWDPIDPIEAREGERIRFDVRVLDQDDNRGGRHQENDLRLSAIFPEDMEEASFDDRGNGRGTFDWQTDIFSAGEYWPRFVAFDGNETDTMDVEITVTNVNRPPEIERIEHQEVIVGDILDFTISVRDPDQEDRGHLELVMEQGQEHHQQNFRGELPEEVEFDFDAENNQGRFVWEPNFDDRGVYSNIQFTATDPSGARGMMRVTITVVVVDRDAPVIADVSPDDESVRNNRPTIRATITDEQSDIENIDLIFDNRRIDPQAVRYNPENGEFTYQPDDELDEGAHRYMIRAVDSYRNTAVRAVEFVVNSNAGVINANPLPEYTRFERIIISGTAEPELEMELWRGNDCLMQTAADGRGEFRFLDVPLNERMNVFRIAVVMETATLWR
ncbi:MAG: hypothetical protein P9M15_00470, partial [Candidatus Electryoneaceae bacterium]|nr:hypothetical protein [Candidatus Electryoneaceae bacterium]